MEIPRNLRHLVDEELQSGEVIKWIGMPRPTFFTPRATGAFIFAIPWTAFALFWTFGSTGFQMPDFEQGNDFMFLFGLPFILIGLGLLSSPLWAYRKSLKTVYVISDQRAITIESGRTTMVRSYLPEQLLDLYRKEKRDGSGDIILSQRVWKDSDGDKHSEDVGFLRISDVREVEQMLKSLAQATL